MRVIKYVGPIIGLASLFYIPKLFELHLEKHEICEKNNDTNLNETEYTCWFENQVQVADLRKNDVYILWYLNVTNLLPRAIAQRTRP